jgi:ABC-type multidrug transport system ATPase subunit
VSNFVLRFQKHQVAVTLPPAGILEVDSVQYSIGQRKVLSNIYFKLEVGQVIGILGRNGCGKTSLLKIVFGTLAANSINVRIDGVQHRKPFTSGKISLLPQSSFLPPNIQVSKAIDLFAGIGNDAESLKNDERISRILLSKVKELSGGLRRYLEIGLILSLKSQFVLLDEPFAEIDPIFREKIKAWIIGSKKTKGIIVSDHDHHNILAMSDKVALLTQGKLVKIEGPSELKDYNYLPTRT